MALCRPDRCAVTAAAHATQSSTNTGTTGYTACTCLVSTGGVSKIATGTLLLAMKHCTVVDNRDVKGGTNCKLHYVAGTCCSCCSAKRVLLLVVLLLQSSVPGSYTTAAVGGVSTAVATYAALCQ
jgi:hypothetical protein